MTISIIGAGFGRTGTMALKVALEMLGCGPCYHMMEVNNNPGHVEHWQEATETGTTDWDALFANYHSCVDWPASAFYETLMGHYPEAKVILSIRDADAWYRSMHNTIYQRMMASRQDPNAEPRSNMAYQLILRGVFEGRFAEEDFAKGIYNAHIDAVKAHVPPEKLLVYETGSGWPPLCEFLNVPEPVEDYPHVNTTGEFRERFGLQS